jgi:uncharacterized protein YndB with AHSA1/START domain
MSAAPILKLVRDVPASQKTVYEAWLNPKVMAQFMKAAPGMIVEDVHVDAKVGGALKLTFVMGDRRIPVTGEYRKLDPFKTLVFTFGTGEADKPGVVTLSFESLGPKSTRLTLEEAGLETAGLRKDHENGWSSMLNQLVTALAA